MALDLTGPKNAPPPSGAPRTRGSSTPAKRAQLVSEKTAEREQGLVGLGQLAVVPLMFTGNMADCGAISKHWPGVAAETAKIAESNANVARVVDFVTAVGPFAGLLTAVLPLAFQILVNHKRLPMHPALAHFGVVSPETMEMQAQADALRAHAEMMRKQAAAEAEIREYYAEQERATADLTI